MAKLTDNAKRFAILVIVLSFIPALIASFILDPDKLIKQEYSFLPACTVQQLFDQPCATCGLSRAFVMIAHGRLDEARNLNEISLLFFMLISFVTLVFSVYVIRMFYLNFINKNRKEVHYVCS
jgi:hypothetical protein